MKHSALRWVAVGIAAMGFVSAGCNNGPYGTGANYDPLLFPWNGEFGPGSAAGSTHAFVIDSNYMNVTDAWEGLDLNSDRVTVTLFDDEADGYNWPPIEVGVRSVFNLAPTRTSRQASIQPGVWFTVVLFDMPSFNDVDAGSSGAGPIYPLTARLQVTRADSPLMFWADVEITGENGKPNPMADPAIGGQELLMFDLVQRRMIRLRGKRGDPAVPGEAKFYASNGDIGGIEFDFRYDPNCLDDIEVFPNTEASNATALVGPVSGPVAGMETVHVVLVDPKGIQLVFLQEVPFNPSWVDETLAGTGPLLDLVGTKPTMSTCDITYPSQSDFVIENLVVTDVDGVELINEPAPTFDNVADVPDPNATFRVYGVNEFGTS